MLKGKRKRKRRRTQMNANTHTHTYTHTHTSVLLSVCNLLCSYLLCHQGPPPIVLPIFHWTMHHDAVNARRPLQNTQTKKKEKKRRKKRKRRRGREEEEEKKRKKRKRRRGPVQCPQGEKCSQRVSYGVLVKNDTIQQIKTFRYTRNLKNRNCIILKFSINLTSPFSAISPRNPGISVASTA